MAAMKFTVRPAERRMDSPRTAMLKVNIKAAIAVIAVIFMVAPFRRSCRRKWRLISRNALKVFLQRRNRL